MFALQIPTVSGVASPPPSLEDPDLTIGERIVLARAAKGWSRNELIRQLGVAHTTVIAWEKDIAHPSQQSLASLSVVLGVPTSVLRGEGAGVTEPQYDAWLAFTETAKGQSMSAAERRVLASMRWDERLGPIPDDFYATILAGLRGVLR